MLILIYANAKESWRRELLGLRLTEDKSFLELPRLRRQLEISEFCLAWNHKNIEISAAWKYISERDLLVTQHELHRALIGSILSLGFPVSGEKEEITKSREYLLSSNIQRCKDRKSWSFLEQTNFGRASIGCLLGSLKSPTVFSKGLSSLLM